MIATVHMLSGAMIGLHLVRKENSPIKALVKVTAYALASHVLLDFIPHVEPSTFGTDYRTVWSLGWWMATIDNVAGCLLLLWLAMRIPDLRTLICLIGVLASWSPDLLQYFAAKNIWTGTIAESYHSYHESIHTFRGVGGLSFGILTTVFVLTASLLYPCSEQILARFKNSNESPAVT